MIRDDIDLVTDKDLKKGDELPVFGRNDYEIAWFETVKSIDGSISETGISVITITLGEKVLNLLNLSSQSVNESVKSVKVEKWLINGGGRCLERRIWQDCYEYSIKIV